MRKKISILFPPILMAADGSNILWGKQRTTVLYGGRASAKSHSIARFLLLEGKRQKHRILCIREVQTSIEDSVHMLLSDLIRELELDDFYTVTQNSIKGRNGTIFKFKGVRVNINNLKSFEGFTMVWAEEAQTMSADSWIKIGPTLRKAGSRIFITFNPENDDDATYVRYVLNPPPDCVCIEMNYMDNPWFSEESEAERADCEKRFPDLYDWIWLGKCKRVADAIIFKDRWCVDTFERPEQQRLYFGLDFGFADEPAAMVRCFTSNDMKKLFVEYEAGGHGITTDEYPEKIFKKIPDSKRWPIRADCSQPATISQLCKMGYLVRAASKWTGCVEDGVTRLKQFEEIVIHERCKETQKEFRNYSYKVDKRAQHIDKATGVLTAEVLPIIVDKHNHYIDSIRYSGEPFIKVGGTSLETWNQLINR